MRKNNIRITALAFVVLVFLSCPICPRAQVGKAPYPAMAPLDQYLIPDENAEIALARSAAPGGGTRCSKRGGSSHPATTRKQATDQGGLSCPKTFGLRYSDCV